MRQGIDGAGDGTRGQPSPSSGRDAPAVTDYTAVGSNA